MILAILGIACIGGLIGLDRTAAGQFMISEPIVSGPLTGWILGDIGAGIVIGTVLELIWVLDIPIGTFVPADSTFSAICATAIAALGSTGAAGPSTIGFCILLTTVMVPCTMMADTIVRKRNARLADVPCASLILVYAGITRAHLKGLFFFFLKSFILFLILVPAGILAVQGLHQLPGFIQRGMAFFVTMLPLLGMAIIASKLSTTVLDGFLLMGFSVAVVAGTLLQAPLILVFLLVLAVGWLLVRYRDQA
ncbi:MAG: PTS sugar transporter subunit IIC [Nitrospirota bacterium]